MTCDDQEVAQNIEKRMINSMKRAIRELHEHGVDPEVSFWSAMNIHVQVLDAMLDEVSEGQVSVQFHENAPAQDG